MIKTTSFKLVSILRKFIFIMNYQVILGGYDIKKSAHIVHSFKRFFLKMSFFMFLK